MDDAFSEEEKQSLFWSLADATPDILALFAVSDGTAMYMNKAGFKQLSPDREGTLRHLGLNSIVSPTSLDLLCDEILPQVQATGSWSGVVHFRDTWGTESRHHATFLSETILARKNWVLLHALVPIEQRAEGVVMADHELLRAILETLPDCVYFKDLSSRFIRISRSMANNVNLSDSSEAIGKTDFDFFAVSHAAAAYRDEQSIISSGKPIAEIEEMEVFEDGRVSWVSTSKFPFHDRKGNVIGTFGVSRNITAKKKAEQEQQQMELRLQLAQKLESVGRLAAGVAHEINTPTQFISDNARFLTRAFSELFQVLDGYRLLVREIGADPAYAKQVKVIEQLEAQNEIEYLSGEVPRTLEQTLEGLGRIARIVSSLKEFSHPSSTGKQPVNVNRSIETALAVSRHEWKYVAEVVTELDPDLPLVPCVVDEFAQCVLNLIINAAHAVEEQLGKTGRTKGVITLRTRSEKEWAVIEVADTGTGIPENVRPHIFEPFFTTKPAGKGTGQGLGIVHTVIVKNHCGQVDFTTESGVGTTFILRLPLAAQSEPPGANGSESR